MSAAEAFHELVAHLHIGFKGTMNALFLKNVAEKTLQDCVGV